jgi:hypothetical protein
MGLRRTDGPGQFVAEADDGTPVAVVTVTSDATDVVTAVRVEVPRPVLMRTDEARTLVHSLHELADALGGPLAVDVRDELVRDAARRAGFAGTLRGPLTIGPGRAAAAGATWGTRPLPERVEELLGTARVARRRTLGTHATTLDITPPDGRAFRVRVPNHDGVMAESVAAAADTLLAVKRRFGVNAAITKLDFDPDGAGFAHGDVVGTAEGASGVIVLNPVLVTADGLAADRQHRAETGAAGVVTATPPYFRVDEVTAHECWHFLDAVVLSSGTANTEFNASLGRALGVTSLELALRGGAEGAPPAWRLAHQRLVTEVSAYAATSPRECTAEMFVRWWFDPAGRSPVIDAFGALVDRYFAPTTPPDHK